MGDATLGNSEYGNPDEEEELEAKMIPDSPDQQDFLISSTESDLWVNKQTVQEQVIDNIDTIQIDNDEVASTSADKDEIIMQLRAQLELMINKEKNNDHTKETGPPDNKMDITSDMQDNTMEDITLTNNEDILPSLSQEAQEDASGEGHNN